MSGTLIADATGSDGRGRQHCQRVLDAVRARAPRTILPPPCATGASAARKTNSQPAERMYQSVHRDDRDMVIAAIGWWRS